MSIPTPSVPRSHVFGSETIPVGVSANVLPGKPDFEWQCRTHRARLLGYCKTLVRGHDDAEDLVQRVFIRSLRYYHTSYDASKSSFFSWCCLQARHILSDDHRHPKPTPSSLDALHDEHEYEPLDLFDITEESHEEAVMEDFLSGITGTEMQLLMLTDPNANTEQAAQAAQAATASGNQREERASERLAVREAVRRLGMTMEQAMMVRRELRTRFEEMRAANRL